jgi:hypothetical protein
VEGEGEKFYKVRYPFHPAVAFFALGTEVDLFLPAFQDERSIPHGLLPTPKADHTVLAVVIFAGWMMENL